MYPDATTRLMHAVGSPTSEIAAHAGVSEEQVSKWIHEYQEWKRLYGRNRRYDCDHHYFDTIDSGDKAYWLGWLAADGCIGDRNTVSLLLHRDDKWVLEAFAKDLHATYPIKDVKPQFASLLQISSPHMCERLIEKGITPRKSLTLQPPTFLDSSLHSHFIRGYFDGDGCMYIGPKNQTRWGVLGTRQMLDWTAASIERACGFSVHPSIAVGNVWRLDIYRKPHIIRLREWLYADSDQHRLERKYEKTMSVAMKPRGRRPKSA